MEQGECDDGNFCTDDECVDGVCVHTPKQNGLPCDDLNCCTSGDVCVDGICQGTPALCNDGNPCTDDECNTQTCVCDYIANNDLCDDDNECTENDVCVEKICVGVEKDCDDENACSDDDCDPNYPGGCIYTPNFAACNDDNKCTENDRCNEALECEGREKSCADNNDCTDDSCDPQAPGDGCVYVNNNNPCDDGDECTYDDTCSGGVCTGTPDPDCRPVPCRPTFGVDGEGYGQGFLHQRSKKMIVEQGSNCVWVRVYYFSREYPEWTGQQSVYNDRISYVISTPGGVVSSDSASVNSLHNDFGSGPFPGGNYKFIEVLVDYSSLAENADSWIQLSATARNIGDGNLGSGVGFKLSCDSVDLVLAGLAEEEETDPGGAIGVCEGSPRVLLTLAATAPTAVENGTYALTILNSGAGRVKLFSAAQGGNEISPPPSGDASELPVQVWVQGDEASSTARDVELKLTISGDNGFCKDVVNVTVVGADLDVDTNRDGSVDDTDADDVDEDVWTYGLGGQGAVVLVNADADGTTPPVRDMEDVDNKVNGDNDGSDLADLVVQALTFPNAPQGWRRELVLPGNMPLRIFESK